MPFCWSPPWLLWLPAAVRRSIINWRPTALPRPGPPDFPWASGRSVCRPTWTAPNWSFRVVPNEFSVPADAHWAGSLKESISRVLAVDLGRRLHSGNVLSFPWDPDARLRYRVAVDVGQFHAVSGQGAILEVAWRVESPDGKTTIRRGNGSFHEPIAGDGYNPVVTAEDNLLAQLADAIAATLRGR